MPAQPAPLEPDCNRVVGEAKFRNADYLDRGTTVRRHVRMAGTRHIGKESHDWERQAMLGLNLNNDIAYGEVVDDLPMTLRPLTNEFGERTAAKALAVSLNRLRAVAADSQSLPNVSDLQSIAARLPAALRLCAKLSFNRRSELDRLGETRDRVRLREAARQLGIDPSNLRRRLRSQ